MNENRKYFFTEMIAMNGSMSQKNLPKCKCKLIHDDFTSADGNKQSGKFTLCTSMKQNSATAIARPVPPARTVSIRPHFN